MAALRARALAIVVGYFVILNAKRITDSIKTDLKVRAFTLEGKIESSCLNCIDFHAPLFKPSKLWVAILDSRHDDARFVLALLLCSGDINPNPAPGAFNYTFRKGFKIAHVNIRSIVGKIDELRLFMSNKSLDVLCVSESWLSENIDDSEVRIEGYVCVRKDRINRRGGGLIVYIKEHLSFKNLDLNDDNDDIETLWLEIIRGKSKPILLGCVYRPPDQPINGYLDSPMNK